MKSCCVENCLTRGVDSERSFFEYVSYIFLKNVLFAFVNNKFSGGVG